MEAAKLNLATRSGIPLERWGSALTVLLEKEFGNIYIEKLRAICLMEADFNWLNKLVFAKRMMDQAYDAGHVPLEQYARRSTQAAHGVLCKVLFCDYVRALHIVAGIPSVDLGNCYDAVAHPIASIALQAFRVPLLTVVLALSVLQTMTFFLRTGYGVSKSGYGGTLDDPTFGLGQGNGMAPSGFTSVSSLMVESYKRLGHASSFVGAWTGVVFLLAAIVYVDDTDLLIVARHRDMSLDAFFEQTQSAVMDWGLIVQATGGYLKATKCFWYMMAWQWKNGVPSLRPLSQLPKYALFIPQKDGTSVPTPMADVSTSKETLGVYSCPAGDFGVHVSEKMAKGKLWVERLRRNRCPPSDGWMGFRYALWPSITYGFAAITPDIDALNKAVQDLVRNVLSPLQVNKNIRTFYRVAPKRFQGLGIPNPLIVMLSQKLHLLQTQFNQSSATGRMLQQSLEVFQMEVGISSNILEEDYSRLGNLASNGWWKHLWQLCHRFKVTFALSQKWMIPLLRSGDVSFMGLICDNDRYTPDQRERINRVRKFKGLHSVADFVLCDGRTPDPFIFTKEPSDSSRFFSVEKPTNSDFALFKLAVENLLSETGHLPQPLGDYMTQPHRPDLWFVSEDRTVLYKKIDNSNYLRYSYDPHGRATRYGTRFSRPQHCQGQFPQLTRASVVSAGRDTYTIHSTAKVYMPSPQRRSFLQRLHALSNQSLWRSFRVDGDGSWIYGGLLNNTLVLMSDGSYNRGMAPEVCSSASIILRSDTGDRAVVTWVEKSDVHTADNYRAELLGAIALQLLVRVALDGKYICKDMRPRFGCDNKTVVFHGNHPYRPMPEKQAQADLLRYLKLLVRESPVKVRYYHVYGHLDEYLDRSQLTTEENLNLDCDEEADTALQQGVETGMYIDRILPDEEFVVVVDGQKLSGSTTVAINRSWGRDIAREHYHAVDLIHRDHFDEVYWDGVEKVMARVPEMFSVWVTKQVSGFCGSNHMLRHIYGDVVDECPNCHLSPERSSHMCLCLDSGRDSVYQHSVSKLCDWLVSQQTDPELTHLIRQYLLSRGSRPMASICRRGSPYRSLAEMQDTLGFQNFVEGRISCRYLHARQGDIERRKLRKHAPHWCNGLILQLLQITHRQWTFRNQTVHYKARDGLTERQQHKIMHQCEALLWTDPSVLLPEDRQLLDVDFESLGDGPAVDRQLWISAMESAVAASRLADGTDADCSEYPPVPLDTEGSIRFRRRRRRRRDQTSWLRRNDSITHN